MNEQSEKLRIECPDCYSDSTVELTTDFTWRVCSDCRHEFKVEPPALLTERSKKGRK